MDLVKLTITFSDGARSTTKARLFPESDCGQAIDVALTTAAALPGHVAVNVDYLGDPIKLARLRAFERYVRGVTYARLDPTFDYTALLTTSPEQKP